MWHVSSRSGVATLRTAIHLLLTYLLTHARARKCAIMTRCRPDDSEMIHVLAPFGSKKLGQLVGGSVAEWLECWTQAQNGLGSNRSRDAVGQQS